MIQLSNVSKFYYGNGVISTGFSKVNLDFQLGEFVAITGESGSGKSTLLNVISGLDTYEEGEMFIDGKETSHYTEKDFEDYRRKYIGNIFQNFNLVNSYTVYQNIELVLLLNGSHGKTVKKKVDSLIEKVGLTEYRNTKVSKLSGGQKQRVAIARALAKDTPIMIADEPTGNLDKASAEEIIRLLAEVAKNKLVIIVTHNYEQVEPYVTRKIKMHDGRVIEDLRLRPYPVVANGSGSCSYNNIKPLSQLKLGVRNALKIKAKFFLLLFIFLFIFTALTAELSAFRSEEDVESGGYNNYFDDTRDTRIVLKKTDGSSFTDTELQNLGSLPGVDSVVANDLLLDQNLYFESEKDEYWLNLAVRPISEYHGTLTEGTMPVADTDMVVVFQKGEYFDKANKKVDAWYTQLGSEKIKCKVSGWETVADLKDYPDCSDCSDTGVAYVTDSFLSQFTISVNESYAKETFLFGGVSYTSDYGFVMVPLDGVKSGTCLMDESYDMYAPKMRAKGAPLKITVTTPYYTDTLNLTCDNTYNRNNFKVRTGLKAGYDDYANQIFVNTKDYQKLFSKDTYQISLLAQKKQDVDGILSNLDEKTYQPLAMKDAKYSDLSTAFIMKLLTGFVTAFVAVVMFFVTYFVIRIIMRSRNTYYSTVRMLGGNSSVCRNLLLIDLVTVANIAAALWAVVYVALLKLTNWSIVESIHTYCGGKDFLLIYAIGLLIAVLVSLRYSKTLFQKSSISTLHEEV